MTINQHSHFIELTSGETLHLRCITSRKKSTLGVVFLLHGAVENGKIFYTHSNKGLAPFLAEQGYRCYVADLRGRGESKPAITKGDLHGQSEAITHDIPAFIHKINALEGKFPDYWVAHSWGGVLMNSVLARFPEYINTVKACAYFGSKRALYNNHPYKFLQANVIWYTLAPVIAKVCGYLPAKKLRWGSDNESTKSHWQSMQWAKQNAWIDSDDGFNYGQALTKVSLAPILHIAAVNDKALAQPIDIKKFIEESGVGVQKMQIYGRKFGHSHDYDHITMLTHPQARKEQFCDVLQWFNYYGDNKSNHSA
ncbi:alpha/beta fold hydrolase [Pseudoalteromonas sp. MMG010]|uniref:alpha/beta fold hydrolase n=1 Tax=Pseudoalteromonas sp. MMG010 TaxID=2822685 RepID=UPI001B3A6D8A|nr:alpha/beta fold hydrolase [Pseudoalteromonas sp. MMG010]MBQ4833741.1 alpha/beta fold hydrolase [Pseudoalteromonas sp. MMG010]